MNEEMLQLGFEDVDEEYKKFIDKFKQKKTTDDCYTPEPIYKVVLQYCEDRYGIDPENVIRPFWPGKDYKRAEYPEGCCVVDNPPFSIITKIVKHYVNRRIRFFLFAPYLTIFQSVRDFPVTAIITAGDVTYRNGAIIRTCFLTNMEPETVARTDTELAEKIKKSRSAEF